MKIFPLYRRFNILVLAFWIFGCLAVAQVENVPVDNQVYEFLDRMGVKGILPLYNNTMIPLSRQEVADDLVAVGKQKDRLSEAEQQFLEKFTQEFMHEIHPSQEDPALLFNGDGLDGLFSQKEKYLYRYVDSNVTSYVNFFGSIDYRGISGDTYGSTHDSFGQIGGRIRGTVSDKLGYYLEGTNGALRGDRNFALSDPRLRGNFNFNNLNSQFFDFTQAYLRMNFNWISVQFGRENTMVGTGYSDRLLLSDNAPVTDFLKIEVHYKSLRFLSLHASLVQDSALFAGTLMQEPPGSNKYLALHRLQLGLFDKLNLGVSEMIIYQRFSPEFGYLNPISFYKSVEHSLGDRDNAFLAFDAEVFPFPRYKFYGTWLIDDIDFSKLGTPWWGNEFGFQAGLINTDLAGIANLDGIVEYTRIDPYVYSNRVAGNGYTNDNIGLGNQLQPNSDQWFFQLQYRPAKQLRTWLTYMLMRHGDNVVVDGQVVKNVGGNVLEGHRDTDSENVTFLDGVLTKQHTVQLRAAYEFITDYIVTGIYEYRNRVTSSTNYIDNYASLQVQVEF